MQVGAKLWQSTKHGREIDSFLKQDPDHITTFMGHLQNHLEDSPLDEATPKYYKLRDALHGLDEGLKSGDYDPESHAEARLSIAHSPAMYQAFQEIPIKHLRMAYRDTKNELYPEAEKPVRARPPVLPRSKPISVAEAIVKPSRPEIREGPEPLETARHLKRIYTGEGPSKTWEDYKQLEGRLLDRLEQARPKVAATIIRPEKKVAQESSTLPYRRDDKQVYADRQSSGEYLKKVFGGIDLPRLIHPEALQPGGYLDRLMDSARGFKDVYLDLDKTKQNEKTGKVKEGETRNPALLKALQDISFHLRDHSLHPSGEGSAEGEVLAPMLHGNDVEGLTEWLLRGPKDVDPRSTQSYEDKKRVLQGRTSEEQENRGDFIEGMQGKQNVAERLPSRFQEISSIADDKLEDLGHHALAVMGMDSWPVLSKVMPRLIDHGRNAEGQRLTDDEKDEMQHAMRLYHHYGVHGDFPQSSAVDSEQGLANIHSLLDKEGMDFYPALNEIDKAKRGLGLIGLQLAALGHVRTTKPKDGDLSKVETKPVHSIPFFQLPGELAPVLHRYVPQISSLVAGQHGAIAEAAAHRRVDDLVNGNGRGPMLNPGLHSMTIDPAHPDHMRILSMIRHAVKQPKKRLEYLRRASEGTLKIGDLAHEFTKKEDIDRLNSMYRSFRKADTNEKFIVMGADAALGDSMHPETAFVKSLMRFAVDQAVSQRRAIPTDDIKILVGEAYSKGFTEEALAQGLAAREEAAKLEIEAALLKYDQLLDEEIMGAGYHKAEPEITIDDILTHHPLHRFAHECDDSGYRFDFSKCNPAVFDLEFVPKEVLDELGRRHGDNYYPHAHGDDELCDYRMSYAKSAEGDYEFQTRDGNFDELHEALHVADFNNFVKGQTTNSQIYQTVLGGGGFNAGGGEISPELRDHILQDHGPNWGEGHALIVPMIKAQRELSANEAAGGAKWDWQSEVAYLKGPIMQGAGQAGAAIGGAAGGALGGIGAGMIPVAGKIPGVQQAGAAVGSAVGSHVGQVAGQMVGGALEKKIPGAVPGAPAPVAPAPAAPAPAAPAPVAPAPAPAAPKYYAPSDVPAHAPGTPVMKADDGSDSAVPAGGPPPEAPPAGDPNAAAPQDPAQAAPDAGMTSQLQALAQMAPQVLQQMPEGSDPLQVIAQLAVQQGLAQGPQDGIHIAQVIMQMLQQSQAQAAPVAPPEQAAAPAPAPVAPPPGQDPNQAVMKSIVSEHRSNPMEGVSSVRAVGTVDSIDDLGDLLKTYISQTGN